MAESRKTLIIDNAIAAISAIAHGETYERTVRTARRNASTIPDIGTADAVWVETTTQTKDPLATLWQVTLNVTFGFLVVDSGDLGKACDDMEADIERALAVDITRGGYAIDTHVISTEEFLAEAQGSVGGGYVTVQILFRHADGNPYAAA